MGAPNSRGPQESKRTNALEQALRETGERLRLAVSAAQLGTFDYDPRLGTVVWDDRMKQIWGLSPDESLDYAGMLARVHPEDQDRVSQVFCAAIAPDGDGTYNSEYRIVWADGSVHWVSATGRVSFAGQGNNRSAVRVIGIEQDITERKRAESALRESERRYRALAETSPDAIIVHRNGEFLYANPAALDLYGAGSFDQLKGRSLFDLLPPNEVQLIPDRTRELEQGLKIPIREASVIRFDRREVPVEAYASRVIYGEDMAVQLMLRDITDRKRADQALRASEERYRGVVENTTAVILRLDPNGIICFANGRALEFFGYLADELIGKHAVGTIVPQMDTTGRDLALMVDQIIHNPDLFHSNSNENMRKNGERVWLEWTNSGIYDADGKLKEFLSVGIDITETKKVEKALHESESRYRAYFHLPTSGIAVTSPDKKWIEVNPALCDMLGYTRQELLSRTWSELTYAEDIDRDCVQFEKVLGAEIDGYTLEKRFVRKDGSIIWVDLSVHCVRSESGTVSYFVALLKDITDRKQAEAELRKSEAQLREADKRKDEFLAMLAHELRNPLAAISSAIELLKRRGPSDPVLDRTCRAAARQTDHMARLLDDLLDVARVTQGKVTLDKADVLLLSVIENAIEAGGPLINARNHRLYVSHPREPMHVHGDSVRLSQAVGNLIHNAAKYTPPEGEIYLVVDREEDEAVIAVRDSGKGIEPELLPHVFELFVQGNRSPDRAEGGLGVGLTLVRSIVELHGGRVEALSQGPGLGSEFRIHLPLLPQAEQSPGEAETCKAEKHKALRILVVDDNGDSAELLSVLLELEGHSVFVANSGPAAIDLALHNVPDVALVDIGMPVMDGYEVARRLRALPELRQIALVAVTGYGQQEDVQKSSEAGFDEHLVKPVDLETLGRVLRKINSQMHAPQGTRHSGSKKGRQQERNAE